VVASVIGQWPRAALQPGPFDPAPAFSVDQLDAVEKRLRAADHRAAFWKMVRGLGIAVICGALLLTAAARTSRPAPEPPQPFCSVARAPGQGTFTECAFFMPLNSTAPDGAQRGC
jgi:hypothetical protein